MEKRIKWSKELVVSELQRLHETGEDISSRYLRNNNSLLYNACRYHFGGLKHAIESAGINHDSTLKQLKWTPELVIKSVKQLYESGEDISSRYLQKNNEPLLNACRHYFGGLKQAIESAGINYDEVRKVKAFIKWTPELIIQELKALKEAGEGMSVGVMQVNNNPLVKACNRYFGYYENAYEATFGTGSYNLIRKDSLTASFQGKQLEKLLSETLEELGFLFIEQDRKLAEDIIPDFVFRGKTGEVAIFDSKLSEWTHNNCDTQEKYTPHCSQLTFVYLRGERTFKKLEGNVFNVSIFFFIDKIQDQTRREELIEKAEALLGETEELEKVGI